MYLLEQIISWKGFSRKKVEKFKLMKLFTLCVNIKRKKYLENLVLQEWNCSDNNENSNKNALKVIFYNYKNSPVNIAMFNTKW